MGARLWARGDEGDGRGERTGGAWHGLGDVGQGVLGVRGMSGSKCR